MTYFSIAFVYRSAIIGFFNNFFLHISSVVMRMRGYPGLLVEGFSMVDAAPSVLLHFIDEVSVSRADLSSSDILIGSIDVPNDSVE